MTTNISLTGSASSAMQHESNHEVQEHSDTSTLHYSQDIVLAESKIPRIADTANMMQAKAATTTQVLNKTNNAEKTHFVKAMSRQIHALMNVFSESQREMEAIIEALPDAIKGDDNYRQFSANLLEKTHHYIDFAERISDRVNQCDSESDKVSLLSWLLRSRLNNLEARTVQLLFQGIHRKPTLHPDIKEQWFSEYNPSQGVKEHRIKLQHCFARSLQIRAELIDQLIKIVWDHLDKPNLNRLLDSETTIYLQCSQNLWPFLLDEIFYPPDVDDCGGYASIITIRDHAERVYDKHLSLDECLSVLFARNHLELLPYNHVEIFEKTCQENGDSRKSALRELLSVPTEGGVTLRSFQARERMQKRVDKLTDLNDAISSAYKEMLKESLQWYEEENEPAMMNCLAGICKGNDSEARKKVLFIAMDPELTDILSKHDGHVASYYMEKQDENNNTVYQTKYLFLDRMLGSKEISSPPIVAIDLLRKDLPNAPVLPDLPSNFFAAEPDPDIPEFIEYDSFFGSSENQIEHDMVGTEDVVSAADIVNTVDAIGSKNVAEEPGVRTSDQKNITEEIASTDDRSIEQLDLIQHTDSNHGNKPLPESRPAIPLPEDEDTLEITNKDGQTLMNRIAGIYKLDIRYRDISKGLRGLNCQLSIVNASHVKVTHIHPFTNEKRVEGISHHGENVPARDIKRLKNFFLDLGYRPIS